MKVFLAHAKKHIFRGLLAIIPVFLSYLTITFIYKVIDTNIAKIVTKFIGFQVPGLGTILLLILLYFIGLIASNVVGRQFFALIEYLSHRIPIINTVYQIGKQVSQTLSLPDKQAFKKVVLIDCFREGEQVIGFVTGTIENNVTKEKLLKVFVPTVPNPTTGFLVMVKEKDIIDPKWTVEEGMKAVVSVGIIGPEKIG